MNNRDSNDIHKYETSWSGPIIVCLSAFVIGISVASLSRPASDEWISWMYFLLLLAAAVDMKLGFSSFIENGTLTERRHFLFRRRVAIADIHKIMYQPTWIIGQNLRSLYFVGKASQGSTIKLANAAYSTKVLVNIIKEAQRQ